MMLPGRCYVQKHDIAVTGLRQHVDVFKDQSRTIQQRSQHHKKARRSTGTHTMDSGKGALAVEGNVADDARLHAGWIRRWLRLITAGAVRFRRRAQPFVWPGQPATQLDLSSKAARRKIISRRNPAIRSRKSHSRFAASGFCSGCLLSPPFKAVTASRSDSVTTTPDHSALPGAVPSATGACNTCLGSVELATVNSRSSRRDHRREAFTSKIDKFQPASERSPEEPPMRRVVHAKGVARQLHAEQWHSQAPTLPP